MKKLLLIAFVFATAFLPKISLAEENIAAFDIEFKINEDSSVDVIEKITYDFENLPNRHGIYRDIPYKYKARGGSFSLRLSDISVANENGKSYNFTKSKVNGELSLKIGDADKVVTGQKTYIIKYKVKRALNYFDNHDEFYWNAIGNGWYVPINNVSARVILPKNTEEIKTECFTGNYGTEEKCSQQKINGDEIDFTSRDLLPGEGITVVIGFAKGAVIKPSAFSVLLETLRDNWIAFLPLFVLAFMYNLWRNKGKDPEGRGTIVAQYEAPDNLSPLEIGTLVDEKASDQDVSSQIISLAVRGYIRIRKTNDKILIFNTTDYEFEKLKNSNDLVNEFDREIMDGIFGAGSEIGKKVKMSTLKNKFYTTLKKILNGSYASLVSKGYFLKNPKTTVATYFGIAVVVAIAGIILGSFLGGIGVFAFIASGIIIGSFSFAMPVKTKKGALAKEYILGLKEYMTVAEKDRLKFHNAPEKNPEHFEKLLPYAMALGVSKEWGEQFKDIYKGNPDWYSDGSGNAFSSTGLVNGLNSFSSSASAVTSSAPSSASSGGSGFSGGGGGGGFGGGGGGSW